jgi:excisionase family DNA binding protein
MRKSSTPQTTECFAFRVNDAVKLIGWSRSNLYKQMKRGTLRTVKVGGRRLVPRDAIEALLKEGA